MNSANLDCISVSEVLAQSGKRCADRVYVEVGILAQAEGRIFAVVRSFDGACR